MNQQNSELSLDTPQPTDRVPGLNWLIVALVVMVTWTIVVKYFVPILWYYSDQNTDPSQPIPIMWDFWPVLHFYMAVALLKRHKWAWWSAVGISIAEILVVVTKFAMFFAEPTYTFWKLLWLTNKIYVLAFFIVATIYLFNPTVKRTLRQDVVS